MIYIYCYNFNNFYTFNSFLSIILYIIVPIKYRFLYKFSLFCFVLLI